ncbi:hypothetical protein WMY93_020614 [Mugilogobius chulae]|uniref:Uncharacterized protein n=1 Tax=Mugilogobius chulae TaxID=88201 RepID=A0AAW0NCV7_9GOBI
MCLELDACCVQGDSPSTEALEEAVVVVTASGPQEHACVRDEAVHRDTRPELRPTSPPPHRSPDCNTSEHTATVKSAYLVRALTHSLSYARTHVHSHICTHTYTHTQKRRR